MKINNKYVFIIAIAIFIAYPWALFSADQIPFKTTLYVNSQQKQLLEGYKIDKVDYFKLIDLAKVLNGSEKQFCIGWNINKKLITITPQKAYINIDNNQIINGAKNGTSQVIFKDYNIVLRTNIIGSDIYVNLRDLMQWINVGVEYDSSNNKLNLNTIEYLLPKAESNPFKGNAEAIDNKYIKDYGKAPGTIHQEAHRAYHNGTYYIAYQNTISEYKPIINQDSKNREIGRSDYDPSSIQFYGDKIYFETHMGSAADHQDIWCGNINGTEFYPIIRSLLKIGSQSMTIYKGKIYTCSYPGDEGVTIKRCSLNGEFEANIVTDQMIGSRPFRRLSYRAYTIFNDKIYYITPGSKLKSVNIDGANKVIIADLTTSGRMNDLVCAYDNYVYYITNIGLFRINVNGKDAHCILSKDGKRFSMEDISIYGDKIAYPEPKGRFGVMNTDGTGRVALPNSLYDVTQSDNIYRQICILNSDYTVYKEVELVNNNPNKKELIKLWAYGDESNKTAWMPSSEPYIYNDKYKYGDISDGTYYIKPAKATNYSLGISAASKDDGAKVILWDHKPNENRKFNLKNTGEGTYIITPKHSGKPISSNEKIGSAVYQGGIANRPECKVFEIIKNGKNYRIKDKNGNYFGVAGGRMTNGTEVIVWSKASEDSQEFIFEKAY